MSSPSSFRTVDKQPAADADVMLPTTSATPAPHFRARRRSPVPLLVSTFATSLPATLKPLARDAAVAAIRATRPSDAVRAARAILQRVPTVANVAIKVAVLARKEVRDERALTRTKAGEDRYTVPFARRIPSLREQHDREHYAWVWRWIEETAD